MPLLPFWDFVEYSRVNFIYNVKLYTLMITERIIKIQFNIKVKLSPFLAHFEISVM